MHISALQLPWFFFNPGVKAYSLAIFLEWSWGEDSIDEKAGRGEGEKGFVSASP